MKKSLVVLLILCIGLLFIAVSAVAESGTCGNKIQWALDEDGVLTLTGSGDMPDFANAEEAPWYSLRSKITKVVFNGEITRIGSNAFAGYDKLKHVTFSTSTKTIGERAFYQCSALASADYMDAGAEDGPDEPMDVESKIPGDVNGDGEVDGRDVIRLMKYLAGDDEDKVNEEIEIIKENCDLNEDTEIDSLDLLLLVKYLGGEVQQLPVK